MRNDMAFHSRMSNLLPCSTLRSLGFSDYLSLQPVTRAHKCATTPRTDLWPQLFSDVSCIALWISSEKILTRLYSVLHWFHKRLEANVKKPRENRCFQTVIVFSFSLFDNSNTCTVLLKIAARLITVSTSVNKEMWVKLSPDQGRSDHGA